MYFRNDCSTRYIVYECISVSFWTFSAIQVLLSYRPKFFVELTNFSRIWWHCHYFWIIFIYSSTARLCPWYSRWKWSDAKFVRNHFFIVKNWWHLLKKGRKEMSQYRQGLLRKIWWHCDYLARIQNLWMSMFLQELMFFEKVGRKNVNQDSDTYYESLLLGFQNGENEYLVMARKLKPLLFVVHLLKIE